MVWFSIWDLFGVWWLVPYPQYALVISGGILIETYCMKNEGALETVFSIVFTLTVGVLSALYFSEYYSMAIFYVGERINLPIEFYLAASSLLIAGLWGFSVGVRKDIKSKKYKIVIFQTIIFSFAVALMILLYFGPYRVDQQLAIWEQSLKQ